MPKGRSKRKAKTALRNGTHVVHPIFVSWKQPSNQNIKFRIQPKTKTNKLFNTIDIATKIFSYLNVECVFVCESVNKQFNNITKNQSSIQYLNINDLINDKNENSNINIDYIKHKIKRFCNITHLKLKNHVVVVKNT